MKIINCKNCENKTFSIKELNKGIWIKCLNCNKQLLLVSLDTIKTSKENK